MIALQHLVDRARHPRQRARELLELRRRLEHLSDGCEADPAMRELAAAMRRLREQLSAAFVHVQSCSGCARGHPLPFGHFPGGHCCGGRTHEIFSDDELAALQMGGTTSGDFRAPRSELAGCVFRGASGCTLRAADRPTLCVRFTCRELERELAGREDGPKIAALQAELGALFRRFVAAREQQQRVQEGSCLDACEPAGTNGRRN
jgi:hypothetical protein